MNQNNHKFNRRQFLKHSTEAIAAGFAPGLWLSGCKKAYSGKKPNVILIVIDSLLMLHLVIISMEKLFDLIQLVGIEIVF